MPSLELIARLADVSGIAAAGRKKANDLLNKIAALHLVAVSLEEARALDAPIKGQVRLLLDDALGLPDLRKVTKKWDPKRVLGRNATLTEVRRVLCDLLDGRLEPLAPVRPTRGRRPA